MSVLCDKTLRQRGQQLIYPFRKENVQPASIDLTLGYTFAKQTWFWSKWNKFLRSYDESIWIAPWTFVLATTDERVIVPSNLRARVDGKSSVGRKGLAIQNAGYIDPGFKGQITLELYNMSRWPIKLYPGKTLICQVSFDNLDEVCEFSYGHIHLHSHYQGQSEVTLSRTEL